MKLRTNRTKNKYKLGHNVFKLQTLIKIDALHGYLIGFN